MIVFDEPPFTGFRTNGGPVTGPGVAVGLAAGARRRAARRRGGCGSARLGRRRRGAARGRSAARSRGRQVGAGARLELRRQRIGEPDRDDAEGHGGAPVAEVAHDPATEDLARVGLVEDDRQAGRGARRDRRLDRRLDRGGGDDSGVAVAPATPALPLLLALQAAATSATTARSSAAMARWRRVEVRPEEARRSALASRAPSPARTGNPSWDMGIPPGVR